MYLVYFVVKSRFLTPPPPSGMLADASGWVRRGGTLRTPSGPRGSSGKEVIPGAAGKPAGRIFQNYANTPPICSYEGSDYQQSFWESGGAPMKMPLKPSPCVVCCLQAEGTCWNWALVLDGTPPVTIDLNSVTLVDYSTTQLSQARQSLGESARYRFVAADIYHLPFVDGLFDAATMIRTLHHMAQAPLALQQVRRVLEPKAAFILEYANKRNLKAILRYLFRKQTWSPFAPERLNLPR